MQDINFRNEMRYHHIIFDFIVLWVQCIKSYSVEKKLQYVLYATIILSVK